MYLFDADCFIREEITRDILLKVALFVPLQIERINGDPVKTLTVLEYEKGSGHISHASDKRMRTFSNSVGYNSSRNEEERRKKPKLYLNIDFDSFVFIF
ncbi:hypothetical protein TNCV_3967911 [Trichonephila clavipes]|nr:hypothetical protein TNCV_3967911 [Trichonephila clavipes]